MSTEQTAAAQRRARPRVTGLYAITPDLDDTRLLVALVDAALAGGAALVQYRAKSADDTLRREQAARIAERCAAHGRPFVVNDRVDVALAIPDAGLHVGRDDAADRAALADIRRALGPERLLGVSCYRDVERARDAVADGADYVAFGSVHPSATKPAAPRAELAVFREARGLGVPLVGIGGITRTNAGALAAAGCDAIAVVTDLFASRDPDAVEACARELVAAFAPAEAAAP